LDLNFQPRKAGSVLLDGFEQVGTKEKETASALV
jgi:hypothetical protein